MFIHFNPLGVGRMNSTYYPDDDILVLHFSDEPVVREVSQGWNINTSYTASGEVAEIVILDAKKIGLYPVAQFQEKQAA
jgi:carotenoid cleavage dioxygenase-like enzyme